MRPRWVAAGVALTVALASVLGVAAAGSQQSTVYRPIEQGFRPVLVTAPPTTAILPDPAALSAGRLSEDGRLIEPALGTKPTGRSRAEQPDASVGSLVVPTPAPTPTPAAVLAAPRVASTPTPAPVPATPPPSAVWDYDPDVSWYGPDLYGGGTACGETLTTTLIGVASRTLPCGTLVTFRNPANGRVVTAPVVDRGPYVSGRQGDLTGGLCLALDHCYTGPLYWHLGR
ncbi:MAG TPA: septal ring lytic transglycosylase RlpA family protein [Candidatus Dormibacteraeota bacterium]|nr:septal ring lytic transglycosylase RlpA family protein [Candidatus Dormibacteraeota bacterium]